MAKKESKYEYPSHFGSHASMVVKDNKDGTVVCKDNHGEYTTFQNRLDNGMADPCRNAGSRLNFDKERKKKG